MSTSHSFHCDYALLLVILSYTISVLGAYCALQWASLIPHAHGWRRAGRVSAAALAMGGGAIWSMHFIGMIACRLPVAVAYDVPLTILSLLVAVAATGAGLYAVAAAPSSLARLVAGGLVTGLGVAAMHYTGMAAMRLPARITYSPALVAASIAIAVTAATAAFWIALTAARGVQRGLGALVMGVAVCGMHYTGMAAAMFVATAGIAEGSGSAVGNDQLGLMVFGATLFVLGLLGAASRIAERERLTSKRTSELARVNEELRLEITERGRMETALRESEARATGIIAAALDAVITMDEHGVITAWNPQAEKTFGWRRDEAIGRRLSETVIPPAFRAAHERGLRHHLETGEGPVLNRRIEMRAQHRDGHEFPVELTISPMTSAGRPAFCGFVRDITERKQAEDTLQERTTYLNTLVEHSPIAIIGRDSSFRIELMNPAFERLFLYERSEIIGRDLDALIAPPDDAHRAEAAELTRRVRAGETVHVTTVRRRKDGTPVDVDIYGVPLVEKGRLIGTYALYHDITRQRQLETQLLHSQKIEAVGTLAGGIAHDFNNLLTTILGYSDLLAQGIGAGSPLRREIEEIQKAGQQAASLTRQLLAFSRKQLAVFKVLSLVDVVRDMDNMIRRLVGNDIEVVCRTAGDGRVKADRGQLEQVLMNLVVNARDAMPAGGTLTIETGEAAVRADGTGEHVGMPPGRYVTLRVWDTGVGMDSDTRSRIFEPFYSTKAKGLGTGLGLSTVYGIVQQSGGHITVDSEPGRGARFTIWLPRVANAASAAERRDAPTAVGGSETILLVEDDRSVRALARTVLTRRGYRVLEAESGDEALALASRLADPIHIVLTDAVMPGMPVARLIAGLRDIRPESKLLIMSGYTNEIIIRRGILDADIPFIQKPFTTDALLRRVRDILG